MEQNNLPNPNFQNIPSSNKRSPLKIFLTIIFLLVIVFGAFYLKKISDEKRDAEYIKMIREKALESLASDGTGGPIDEVAAEKALQNLVSDNDNLKKELTPTEKKEIEEMRQKALESL